MLNKATTTTRQRNPCLFVTTFCFILITVACYWPTTAAAANGTQQSTATTTTTSQHQQHDSAASARPSVQIEASINLKSIWQHQSALAEECAQLKAIKLGQIKQVANYLDTGDAVHLPDRLAIKLPAVCLFLFGPPETIGQSSANDDHQRQARLDQVNWIFDTSELIDDDDDDATKLKVQGAPPPSLGSTRSKRLATSDATSSSNSGANTDFLADYLFDMRSISSGQDQQNELITNEQANSAKIKQQFHKQMDQLIHDQRFHQAIEAERPRLTSYLSPVILVPGLLGSRLQSRVVLKQKRANIFCSKQSDWQDIWLSLRMFVPVAVDCWLDNVKLDFNPKTNYTKQPQGVESRVPDFGSIESVRYLDLRSPTLTKYFSQLIEHYEQLGYTPDLNLFAAPYDFRLAPQLPEIGDIYFVQLRELIEKAKSKSSSGSSSSNNLNNDKVTLVCHSMGCTHLLVFLRQQSSAWRQHNIRKVIALSSPWAGTVKALKALVVGDSLDLPLISETKMRKLARGYPSIGYLLPQMEVFERPNKNRVDWGGETLVETPLKQYKVNELKQLLDDLNLSHQWRWFQEASSLIRPLEPLPDVRIDCIHSLNVPTAQTLVFRNQTDFPNGDYELISGDGDGTVNEQSLIVCADWANKYPDKVKHLIIMNTNHLGVLSHPITLTHITDDVLTTNGID